VVMAADHAREQGEQQEPAEGRKHALRVRSHLSPYTGWQPPRRSTLDPNLSRGEQCTGCASGLWSRAARTTAPAFGPYTTAQGALARDLPETALLVTSRRPTTQPFAAPFTCAIVWARMALRGVANHRRIDGKDGVAGSIPAGGSTNTMTSGNAGRRGVRGRICRPESTSHVGKRSEYQLSIGDCRRL
jgi:hypothetical protein